jgi:hypothetical protein
MKLGEVLSIASFSPSDIDVTFIKNAAAEVSNLTHITPEHARELATKFLAALDVCSTEYARLSRFVGRKRQERNKEHAEAMLIRSQQRSNAAQGTAAERDEDYNQKVEEFEEANAYLTFFLQYIDFFKMAHYWAKGLVGMSHEESFTAGYERSEVSRKPEVPKNQESVATTQNDSVVSETQSGFVGWDSVPVKDRKNQTRREVPANIDSFQ